MSVDYVSALFGARRLTRWASPIEQIRRVANTVTVTSRYNTKTVLLFLEQPVRLDDYVNPVCVATQYEITPMIILNSLTLTLFFNCFFFYFIYRTAVRSLIKQNHCVAVGLNDTLLTSSANVTSLKMITLHTLSAIWMNNETLTCPPVNQ